MGTISFTAKFKGMRREQEFIVYANPDKQLKIQANKKFGYIDIKTGNTIIANCEYGARFMFSKRNADIVENIEELKQAIRLTASKEAGTSGVITCDNSKAVAI